MWNDRNTSSSLSALSHSFWPGACCVHMVISWLMLSVTALLKPIEKGGDVRDMRYAWDEGERECVGEGGRVKDMAMRKTEIGERERYGSIETQSAHTRYHAQASLTLCASLSLSVTQLSSWVAVQEIGSPGYERPIIPTHSHTHTLYNCSLFLLNV